MDMDLHQLRTFCQVAEWGSITAAADELGITQSAVSRQISALESSINARLFDRRARGVLLTEHGRCLLPHAQAVLDRLGAARRALSDLDDVRQGRLRVGAFATANAALVPHALAAFRHEHPGIALSLAEGSTHRQLAWLDTGDVDVAVLSAFPDQHLPDTEVELTHMLDDPMLVALPRSHRFARRHRLRLAELAEEHWIAADPATNDRLLGPARLRPDFAPLVDFVVHEWTAKLGFVAAGLGITVVPSLAAYAARADVALVALHPDESSYRRIFAATAKARAKSPATVAFLTILRARSARHSRGLAPPPAAPLRDVGQEPVDAAKRAG